jgi:hypothetical protein
MTNSFWDENFQVKALKPQFKDAIGVVSPVTIAASDNTALKLPVGTKAVMLIASSDIATISLEISKDSTGAAYEMGAVLYDLTKNVLELPTEELTFIRVSNEGADEMQLSFIFLTT